MFSLAPLEPINYLLIGHLTYDLTPTGPRIGGTAAYAGLTAHALGLRVGIVTSWGGELPLGNLKHIPIISYPADHSTTFENIYTEKGRVQASEWPEAAFTLQQSGAAVLSIEDVQNDESRIEEMASASRILVVTEGPAGARVYWNGDVRRFKPPQEVEIDPTGAGDIFAAAFFTRLYLTRDPWESARFANQIAAASVTRVGLDGIPTPEEIQEHLIEVL